MPADTIPLRKGRKMPQVLEGARKVFLRDGFEGASVDDIAREAGVSKATLYSYFPDKRLLFLEVAKAECLRQAEEAVALITSDLGPREVLTMAATRIVDFVLSDFGIRTYRICVAEADRFPELGHEFYESGPALVRQRIVDYLRQAVARHELIIEDLELAADQFAELCKADLFNRIVFGVGAAVSAGERRRVVAGVVEMFLARYAPKG
ncbi:TetR/AcrR family transcriptional regulator [Cereibacter azotoformans]|uniref:TetR family transcriptional regulator n=1 Tax=Cereibacter azotoformans TaxID=43057 RepID=A0A2T5JYS2_9RHOB|nr:TetR/AcrR family transcriptional regulator [Cereibacter azotoformans]AXQ94470.1 TetR/AcrR family transcriptional regulator [Cereibacter sphaeroides]MBO4170696.1 TetR/AcrR family transcriptional regulator [Cereibacter azotoformans]PTR15300.1 TetR family transcriptional regulator [Cereibacter azotoformans]UIJ30018.1 TetR/AcrR family transcriptional regulator [Cereibacter azotoformans]